MGELKKRIKSLEDSYSQAAESLRRNSAYPNENVRAELYQRFASELYRLRQIAEREG